MSKVIRTTKPSVLPWYAAALVFAVLCAVLPVYKLWALLVALGCAGAAFGAAQKVCPPRVVEHNAASIATAFENQLDALYAAESMDLSADLTVLQNMLKGQGLS